MTIIQAIALGAIQGLTEFLPISSSAHLLLAPWFFGWRSYGLPFDVALHAGTALAVLTYFRNVWFELARGLLASLRQRRLAANRQAYLAWLIIIGTIPGVLVGAFGEDYIQIYLRSPLIVALMLIAFGLLLLYAERKSAEQRALGALSLSDSVYIGSAQALALIPGVSRSGITITAGLLRDFDRRTAAEFSFMLSAPIIAGAALKELMLLLRVQAIDGEAVWVFAAGAASAAVVGFLCIKYFLRYVQTRSLLPFVVYRLLLGVIIIIYAYTKGGVV